MNACNLSCVIFLASSGKAVYLFGDISANLTPVEAEGIFDCAGKYYMHPEDSF
ncbi:MAG: hypothetical protein AAFS12_06245 [Cyanobacteria bacterium J06632_19]